MIKRGEHDFGRQGGGGQTGDVLKLSYICICHIIVSVVYCIFASILLDRTV